MFIRNIIIIAIVALIPSLVLSQKLSTSCKPEYENHNQIECCRLSISSISGHVVIQTGGPELSKKKDVGALSNACLGLLSEDDHHLIANTISDDKGNFKFGAVPPGLYRLVVNGPFGGNGLCTANVSIRVVSWMRRRIFKRRKLVIHMRVPGIDDCSYGDYK